ncbi:MAG: RIP metalloprotease RseP [Gemmatimonadota bacterium]|jgi:regulator of sigma E protease
MTILATIIVLGVLIFVHELGHFLAAKGVGIDVERFSIGLGPRLTGFRWGETEYVLSAIPLGGYVKMGGMEDQIMEAIEGGASDEPREPGPGDFDGKPIWARTIVISAGVVMNFLFAFVAYSVAIGFWGFQEPATTRVGDVRSDLLAPGAESLTEIQRGQRVVRVGGTEVSHWGDVRSALLDAPAGPVTLELSDPPGTVEARLPTGERARARTVAALQYWREPVVGIVNSGSPAEEGGLEEGDRILAVEGTTASGWFDFVDLVEGRAGERTEIRLERDGRELVRVVTPEPTEETDPVTGETRTVGKIGIWPPFEDMVSERATFSEAVVQGWRATVGTTGLILSFLRDLVTGNVSPRSVGSIVTIGEASGQAAALGTDAFLRFMALFSVNLAILNLLPIPILDGGHLLFLAIEAVRGKALSVEQRLRWSNVGFLIVMGIMIWALSNDVLRLFGL